MSSQPQHTPATSSVLFARGVIARLEVWSVLRVAVQEGWGGSGAVQKRTWIASEIVDAFENQVPIPDDQYIEELLLQIVADEFDANLEDGSAESVAQDIVRMWEEARFGRQETVLKFEELAEKLRGRRVEPQIVRTDEEEWEDDDDDDDAIDEGEGDEEVPQLLPPSQGPQRNESEVDEDGFTLVKGRGKGRK